MSSEQSIDSVARDECEKEKKVIIFLFVPSHERKNASRRPDEEGEADQVMKDERKRREKGTKRREGGKDTEEEGEEGNRNEMGQDQVTKDEGKRGQKGTKSREEWAKRETRMKKKKGQRVEKKGQKKRMPAKREI